MSDKPEALLLAGDLAALVQTYPQMSDDEAGGYCTEADQIMDHAAAELRRLHAENERLREDAARYRWLRGDSCPDHSVRWTHWEVRRWRAPYWTGDLRGSNLDAAIDAALEGKE